MTSATLCILLFVLQCCRIVFQHQYKHEASATYTATAADLLACSDQTPTAVTCFMLGRHSMYIILTVWGYSHIIILTCVMVRRIQLGLKPYGR